MAEVQVPFVHDLQDICKTLDVHLKSLPDYFQPNLVTDMHMTSTYLHSFHEQVSPGHFILFYFIFIFLQNCKNAGLQNT